MAKKKHDKREGNQYDKIVKENIEAIIPALMNTILGIEVREAVVIREKLQQTKEKEADALRLVTTPSNQQFILHLEFQVDDYPKMIFRMLDYWGLLKAKYGLPVRQFVIYIGEKQPGMQTVLVEDGNQFQFQLVNVSQFGYQRFLQADKPEEIMLAILSNFGDLKADTALSQIVQRIDETTTDQLTFSKYLRQLRVLSKLRSLETIFDDMLHNLEKYIDVKNDSFYIRGRKDAQTEEQTRFVKALFNKSVMSDEQIADIVGVSVEFVREVKQSMAKLD